MLTVFVNTTPMPHVVRRRHNKPTTAQPSTNARGRTITRGGAACKHSPSDVIRSLAGRETSCGNEIQHGRAHDRDEPGPKHCEYSETNSNISQNTVQTGANNIPEPAHGRAGPLTTAHGPPNDNGAARETEHRCPGQEYTATDIPAAPHTYTVPDFDAIRKVCETNDDTHSMDTHPRVFRDYRRHEWPTFSENTAPNDLVFIYNTVRETGLPNCMKARIELPSNLHLDKWAEYLGDAPEDTELLDFLHFGFPLGYMGPTSHVDGNVNHPSATKYPEHVDQFIKKELSEGCMLGPYDDPVFTPWLHCSPLMTRPKRESTSRRVITDMTHPNDCSINSYVIKNSVFGIQRQHSLPTVDHFVKDLVRVGPGAYMSTIDLQRAYKNLRSDVLDWPLLCLKWGGGGGGQIPL